jgi:glycine dehydrogenase
MRINLESCLADLGFEIPDGIRFDSVDIYSEHAQKIHIEALKNGYNLRILPLGSTIENSTGFGISLDQLTNEKEIKDIVTFIANILEKKEYLDHIKFDKGFYFESLDLRSSKWMQQDIFVNYQSETELMRYIFRLVEKDFSLVDGMMPLGSCTMKLNSAAELNPVSWANLSSIHPFSPLDQTKGYSKIISDLEKWISDIVGLKSVSFQPNAGSQGEFAGLLAINSYFESKGELSRKNV